MIEVVSIKFKNRGKCYFFAPGSLKINAGDKVIVETSKGLEIADCCRGNHDVPETSVVQPLRPVVRVATSDDLRVEELNRKREREAFDICQQKIIEHGLDMKLVDVECNFEGNKTLFFFTSDGRVDFRELVKDLAGIFRNRIELRQIGVRDEAKMIGGLGICGRPYCCSQFLDDFQPVSTKMAKVQSLSLNPTKISGSCGRLMCCLRYEEDAYEDLIKHVPKQGAFVETKDGYGTAVQVNLLRQNVKVKLDSDADDDALHVYKANELCAVPGGRPKDGQTPPSVLNYVPGEDEDEDTAPEDDWNIPTLVIPEPVTEDQAAENAEPRRQGSRRNGRRRRERGVPANTEAAESKPQSPVSKHQQPAAAKPQQAEKPENPEKSEQTGRQGKSGRGRRPHRQEHGKTTVKPVKVETKPGTEKPTSDKPAGESSQSSKPRSSRRRYYRGKPKRDQ